MAIRASEEKLSIFFSWKLRDLIIFCVLKTLRVVHFKQFFFSILVLFHSAFRSFEKDLCKSVILLNLISHTLSGAVRNRRVFIPPKIKSCVIYLYIIYRWPSHRFFCRIKLLRSYNWCEDLNGHGGIRRVFWFVHSHFISVNWLYKTWNVLSVSTENQSNMS